MDDNNGLRDEGGALIGGLVVLDYVQGIDDFNAGVPPPENTSPSYDLGRQRAAEKRADAAEVARWIRAREEDSDRKMRELLPPEMYAEYRAKIDTINKRTPGA